MLYNPSHPALMRPTLPGFVWLWRAGLDAASVNLAYAINAVGSGMSLEDFGRIGRSQFAMNRFINEEYKLLTGSSYEYPEPHRRIASRFKHDILDAETLILRIRIELVETHPDSVASWHEDSREAYRLDPTVKQMVEALFNRRFALETDRFVNAFTSIPFNLKFADERILRGARIIFKNLIDNAVKYSSGNGNELNAEIPPDDLTTFKFTDMGIGMDPAFAARLGHEDLIREERAEGVDGSGIGWTSIAQTARELGWSWKVYSAPYKGTKVNFTLKEGDLVEADSTPMGPEARFDPAEMFPAQRFADHVRIFSEASPLTGYQIVDGPEGEMIDVSQSPLYGALLAAQPVLELLKKSLVN